jgi:hypothetical protein
LRYVTHRLMVMHPHYKYYWPISKDKNVMAWTRKYYLKTIIWPWGQRSRSHEGHYGMWHTALWSCTHIPNKYYLKTIIWSWGQRSRSHEGHYQRQNSYGPDKLRWGEAEEEAEEKISLKQYVSLRSKGRHH